MNLAPKPFPAVVENGAVASLAGGAAKFPLVVFSPGNGSMRTTYSLMCSEMASRGVAQNRESGGDSR